MTPIRTGAHASARTGAVGPTSSRGVLVVAAAEGALAYALLAPKFFATRHPIVGGIFAVLSVLDLATAVS